MSCITAFSFSLFLSSLWCIKKAMQSLWAHPTVGFAGSFSFPGSLTGCQTLQAMYWRGDKHWPALINQLVWLFPILYYNGIHSHTPDTDAYLDQSVLVCSSHSCQRGASTEKSASRGEQRWWLMVFSVVCPLIVTEAGKDSADWWHSKTKGLCVAAGTVLPHSLASAYGLAS